MNTDAPVHILFITYNRPHYVRLSLPRLLETCREQDRVWIWHNGNDAETLESARAHAEHPNVAEFRHSQENALLRIPTNRFWDKSDAPFLGKVDDDCLMPDGWIERLLEVHAAAASVNKRTGVLMAWPFQPDDYDESVARKKVRDFGGEKIMVNPWTGGSGYIMPAELPNQMGPIPEGLNFTGYCIRAALKGYINGWPVPLLLMDHMDDPRSPNTGLKTDEDFQKFPGLTARRFGMASLDFLKQRQRIAALEIQRASPNPRDHVGLRGKVRRAIRRITTKGRKARFDA